MTLVIAYCRQFGSAPENACFVGVAGSM